MKRSKQSLAENLDTSLWKLLPHDGVEVILECVPVKPLLRFRCVSKKWKLTIDSPGFKERQLMRRRQLRGPDVLIMSLSYDRPVRREGRGRKVVLSAASASRRRLGWNVSYTCGMFCAGSCDGLVCVYCLYVDSIVGNPATGWHRSFPLSNYQGLLIQRFKREGSDFPWPSLGFGRDKLSGTFKPVWLYNSSGFVLGGADKAVVTYCEVFDFSTNAWRYVVPASPYPINAYHKPVHLDGSLYWLTESEPPLLLSFDLHTETFQVICKAPFADPRHITMCVLHNRLCLSEQKHLTQVIWSFDSSDKTWNTLCSFDLNPTGDFAAPLLPIAILDKGQLLLQGRASMDPLVIHDLHYRSYDLLCTPKSPSGSVYYFESLFSA
ncbi:F-box protein At1g11270-like [Brassica napus]|uniref:F-box protein At1g11270-like n=1 Tax=Brassica napus TaxID=3708 RepID=UPI0020789B68|nr:F-box protein At1g11270-like [Brassica napus]